MPMIVDVLTGNQKDCCLSWSLLMPTQARIGCSEGEPEITITYQDATFSPIIIGSGSFFMKLINA
jgi:hypothetical protein